MRVTGSRTYYTPIPPKMPPGLVELLEGLTKEVLRHNPSDVYSFCATHMEQLLEKRDGPSRKKFMSLEEKIVKAQEKVRQRAEKRCQDDTKYPQHQINSNASNDTSADVAKLTSIQESPNVSPKQDIQSIVKAPIHHLLELKDSSEVEISQNVSKNDIGIDLKTTHDVIGQIDTIYEDTNESLMQSSSDKKENEIKNLTLPSSKLDPRRLNEHEFNLEEMKVTDKFPSNIAHECVRETDINLNTDAPVKEDHPKSEQEISSSLTHTLSEVRQENDKKEADAILNAEKSTNKITEDQAKNITENADGTFVSDNSAKELINIITMSDQNVQISSNMNLGLPDNTEKSLMNTDLNETEQKQLTDHTKDAEYTVSGHTANGKELVISDNDHKGTKSDFNQESENNKDYSQIQNVDDVKLSLPNKNLIETDISHVADSGAFSSEPENTEDNVNQKSTEKVEAKDLTPVFKSDAQIDLPTPDVDSDIQTLITEETKSERHQCSEINNDTRHIIETDTMADISQGDKQHVVFDKQTCNSEDLHNIEEISTKEIEILTNESTHNNEKDYDGKNKDKTSSKSGDNDNREGSNMDLETAAVTIQKVFRTFLFKSRGSTFEETANDENNFLDEHDKDKEDCGFSITSALHNDRRAHGITRMDTVLQTVNEEKSLSLSDDSSTLSSAATIIQAHVRGFLVRNKLNPNKTLSTHSLAASYSNERSITSLEADNDQNKNKTVLNIHIVPGGESYLSRDESLITSMELSLDSSPTSSINLHPLGYDKSERRKQLKREDAIQSISPPSNNSGKLSEDFDSVKELSLHDQNAVAEQIKDNSHFIKDYAEHDKSILVENHSFEAVVSNNKETADNIRHIFDDAQTHVERKRSIVKMNSDEMDVVTPFLTKEESVLIHSGEFHDAVLPTKVSRSDTTVVSEFKNVLVYFLLWNHT